MDAEQRRRHNLMFRHICPYLLNGQCWLLNDREWNWEHFREFVHPPPQQIPPMLRRGVLSSFEDLRAALAEEGADAGGVLSSGAEMMLHANGFPAGYYGQPHHPHLQQPHHHHHPYPPRHSHPPQGLGRHGQW
jgi:hypothetical protein